MRRATGEPTARRDLLLSAGCTTLALIALLLPHSWGLAISAGLRQTALRPVVVIRDRAELERTSRFHLSELQRGYDSLALLVQQETALRRENDNLRAIAGVRARLPDHIVAAEVLHRAALTDSRMLLLDVGSSDGVQAFDPVVTADGLVGYIVSVASHSSMTFTWDNSDFAASAVTADGKIRGFVYPAPHVSLSYPALEMRGVALGDSIRVGSVVLTAGAGSTFPRGIPIGRVVAIEREVYGYDRVYRVAPFANPGDASHVVVLVSPHDSIYRGAPPAAVVLPATAPAPPLSAPVAGHDSVKP